jgi:nitrate/nitrite transporter NarK
MGLEMSIARLGVFAAMWLSPLVYNSFGEKISTVVLFGALLLLIGLIFYIVFVVMDRKFDKQLEAAGELTKEANDEEFKLKDLGKIFSSKMFCLVALLCVLYYSAIFPFQRYAPDFLNTTLGVENGSQLFSCFPILAMVLTPFLGAFIDNKGKAASMLMFGSLIMIACHLAFAFLLPVFPYSWLAVTIVVILGVSFSLVPAALWPSVPKIIDNRILGSAYCIIFWIQNIGLFAVPILIGTVKESTGGYTLPMVIFSMFGVLALFFSLWLKVENKKHNFGLEEPNIKK